MQIRMPDRKLELEQILVLILNHIQSTVVIYVT